MLFLDGLAKVFLKIFHHSLPRNFPKNFACVLNEWPHINDAKKEFTQQKEKGTVYMVLFIFMSGVQFLVYVERNQVDQDKS